MHPGGQAILFATDLDESSSVNAQLCELRKDGTMVDDSTQGGELEASEAGAEARHHWTELAQRILDAQDAYYARDAPTISDAEYDRLMVELKKVEDDHPSCALPTRPLSGLELHNG